MSNSLYELASDYMQVLSLLEEGVDVQDTLDAIEGAFEDKAENVGKAISMLSAKAEGIKTEEKRLKARREALEKQAKNLKEYLFNNMKQLQKKKIEGQLYTFSIRKNPPKLLVEDLNEIPFEYYKAVEPQLDTNLVKEQLKLGKEVPGARLEQGESLQIK